MIGQQLFSYVLHHNWRNTSLLQLRLGVADGNAFDTSKSELKTGQLNWISLACPEAYF